MSITTTETTETSLQSTPAFSFPPKYSLDEHSKEASSSSTRTPPNFGFPDIKNPEPSKEPTVTAPFEHISTPPKQPPFLTIPLEIRLHIYDYVLASHPIFHAHLAPPPESWSTSSSDTKVEEFHTIVRPLGQSLPTTSVLRTTAPTAKPQQISALYPISTPSLASPKGSLRGKIPTGLLVSCKQIYGESRMLPWETNTFAFINWFWSGVYASRQFTRGLRPWQSEGMRWVGVEVLGRDLAGTTGPSSTSGMVSKWGQDEEQKSRSEWGELCDLWRGVWGLRLGIKGSVKLKKSTAYDYIEEGGIWVRPEEIAIIEEEPKKEKGILDMEQEWVSEGLLQMKNLRWLELEIEDQDVDREDKIRFCGELEEKFNSKDGRDGDWHGPTRVIFVEKKKREEVKNTDFKWYGGEPGDDSIWGLDM